MPVTALDPLTALLVIDLQSGIHAHPTTEPVDQITRKAGTLAKAFRSHGLPVVLVNVDSTPATRTDHNPSGTSRRMPESMTAFVEDLNQQPSDHTIPLFTAAGPGGTPSRGNASDQRDCCSGRWGCRKSRLDGRGPT